MNPLLIASNRVKMQQLLGFIPVDVYLDIIWEQLTDILGYNPISEELEERYNGNNSSKLYLNKRPITAIEEIKINNEIKEPTEYEFTDSYILFLDYCLKGFLDRCDRLTMGCYEGTDKLIIKYTAGYEPNELPSKMLYAASLLYRLNADKNSSKNNLTSYKIDTISYNFKDNYDRMDEINNVLSDYKVVVI